MRTVSYSHTKKYFSRKVRKFAKLPYERLLLHESENAFGPVIGDATIIIVHLVAPKVRSYYSELPTKTDA